MSEETKRDYDASLAAMKSDAAFMEWLNDYFGGDGSWTSEYSGTWFSLYDAWCAGKAEQWNSTIYDDHD